MKKVLIVSIITLSLYSCCKHKHEETPCIGGSIKIMPFKEKFAGYWCNDNEEFTYIFRRKIQIDSLEPNCSFIGTAVFPVDDIAMAYILLGRSTHYINDSFSTELYKDTCLKKLFYNVNFIQTDTVYHSSTGIVPIYCFVENIPADYQVEIKYKYVPK